MKCENMSDYQTNLRYPMALDTIVGALKLVQSSLLPFLYVDSAVCDIHWTVSPMISPYLLIRRGAFLVYNSLKLT